MGCESLLFMTHSLDVAHLTRKSASQSRIESYGAKKKVRKDAMRIDFGVGERNRLRKHESATAGWVPTQPCQAVTSHTNKILYHNIPIERNLSSINKPISVGTKPRKPKLSIECTENPIKGRNENKLNLWH